MLVDISSVAPELLAKSVLAVMAAGKSLQDVTRAGKLEMEVVVRVGRDEHAVELTLPADIVGIREVRAVPTPSTQSPGKSVLDMIREALTGTTFDTVLNLLNEGGSGVRWVTPEYVEIKENAHRARYAARLRLTDTVSTVVGEALSRAVADVTHQIRTALLSSEGGVLDRIAGTGMGTSVPMAFDIAVPICSVVEDAPPPTATKGVTFSTIQVAHPALAELGNIAATYVDTPEERNPEEDEELDMEDEESPEPEEHDDEEDYGDE